MNFDKVIRAYIALRDARAALAKDYDAQDSALKAKQKLLEGVLLKHMLDNPGLEGVRTDSGMAYMREDVKVSASDWDVLYDWIREHNAFDALEKRVTRKFVQDYMAEHDGSTPPGVTVYRENTVTIRRT